VKQTAPLPDPKKITPTSTFRHFARPATLFHVKLFPRAAGAESFLYLRNTLSGKALFRSRFIGGPEERSAPEQFLIAFRRAPSYNETSPTG